MSVIEPETEALQFTEVERQAIDLMAKGYHYATLKEKMVLDNDRLIHILGDIIRKRRGGFLEEKHSPSGDSGLSPQPLFPEQKVSDTGINPA
ncbi:MAG: hypothetical protein ABID87_08050 [Chloroflexota bacterium]